VDPATAEALAAIDRAVAWVREQADRGWPPLSATYLKAVDRVEGLPQNQSGADKSWIWESVAQARRHFAAARRG